MFKNISEKKFYLAQITALCIFTLMLTGIFLLLHKKMTIAEEEQSKYMELHELAGKLYDGHLAWAGALRRHIYEGNAFDSSVDLRECDFGKWYAQDKPRDPGEAALYQALEAPHTKLHESAKSMLASGDTVRKRAILISVTEPVLLDLGANLADYKTFINQRIKTGRGNISDLTRNNLIFTLCALFLISAAAIAGFFINNKKLFKPLAELSSAMDSAAKGDLTAVVQSDANDEIGQIEQKMEEMLSNMGQRISQIANDAGRVANSAGTFSSTASELNDGARELSSQTEQIVTSMTEVSQTIMDMAKNASDAADASKNAATTASKGKQIVDTTAEDMMKIALTVQEAANTIEELGKSSAQIGEIVAVINGIADQTNMLALNAAIEAARAGEQGRGFAVVADEVRKLAERTGRATKDIDQRITAIQAAAAESVGAMKRGSDEVAAGVGMAKEASASLEAIVTASTNAVQMVQRIAIATEQQSAATEEVTQTMENIAGISKRSAASAGQISASAAELAKLAAGLKKIITWFRV